MQDWIILTSDHSVVPQIIKLCRGDIVFWVDDLENHFPTIHSAEAISVISEAYPRTVTSEELFRHLNAQIHIGDQARFSDIVYKHVSHARAALAKAGIGRTLIQTVRNFGYRLGWGWSVKVVQEPASLIQEDLFELRNLLDRCIAKAWVYPMITASNGIMYLDADKGEIQSNFLILDRLSWLMVETMSRFHSLDTCMRIKNDFDILMSYVLFRRIGQDLSHHKWRSLYESELNTLFHEIEQGLRKVIGRS